MYQCVNAAFKTQLQSCHMTQTLDRVEPPGKLAPPTSCLPAGHSSLC